MGFLDNSGDIILDAVLTDLGRERLARGDGSFKITKFAAADDEIDYGKYNKNHPSGSAYYDLDILTTPVLEAFTNNIGSVKHKLMSIPRNNLLYLPVIKLVNDGTIVTNSRTIQAGTNPVFADGATGMYAITVDSDTSKATATGGTAELRGQSGVIKGDGTTAAAGGTNVTRIVLDQGLDTAKIPNTFQLDSDLIENQFIVELDDRLGKLTTSGLDGADLVAQVPNFIDDDRVASYYISKNNNSALFDSAFGPASTSNGSPSAVAGPRGNRLWFAIKASLELNTSQSLFDRLGGSTTITGWASGATFKYIDSTVRITGVTTGYRIDIPIRFIKKV